MPTSKTVLKGGHVIAWDGAAHLHIKNGVVAYEDDSITFVGTEDEWTDDEGYEVIDCAGRLVTPGFVNLHAHIGGSPLDKSFIEDVGSRNFWMSGLYEMLPARAGAQDEEGTRASIAFSMAELILSGTTTLFSMDPMAEAVAEKATEVGLRTYVAPLFRSGKWITRDGRNVGYEWDEQAGFDGLDTAVRFIEERNGSVDGLIKGMLCPLQVDTCTEELFKRAVEVSIDLDVPIQTHAAQAVVEFHEMMRRHGRTPIEWLHDIGFLGRKGPQAIIGHGIFLNSHSQISIAGDDLDILADSGASVAHAPWVFARRGIALESFGRYVKAGVNMTLGTDTSPQSMLEAMKWAAVVGKLVEGDTNTATAADVFHAATVGGATALGRDDLGRLSKGAKADILVWDVGSVWMVPMRDPIKNLVYSAREEDLRQVVINGRTVMEDRVFAGFEVPAVTGALQAAGERLWPRIPQADWAERHIDEMSPRSAKPWDGGSG